MSLEWSQVNIERREITLLKTKTSIPRVVPLTNRALDVLRNIRCHWSSTYVFCKDDGSRYKRLTRGLAGAVRRG